MQLVPLTKLVPYVNNARTHSPEQINKLRSSLREFGFINPVIIDRDYGIIAGHGRVLAAKEEGITEIPCVFVDYLTEAQKKAYIIADNRMALDAGWDEELLRVEIEALQGEGFDLGLTGFDEKELADLFKGEEEGVLTLCLHMLCANAVLSQDEVDNFIAFAEILGVDEERANTILDEFVNEEEDLIVEGENTSAE